MSRLGELLVRENLISLSQLQKAQDEQRKTGARLGYSLTKLGILDCFKGVQLYEGYGSTEAGIVTTLMPEEQLDHRSRHRREGIRAAGPRERARAASSSRRDPTATRASRSRSPADRWPPAARRCRRPG